MIRRLIYFLVIILLSLSIYFFFQRITDKPQKETNTTLFQAIPNDAVLILNSSKFLFFDAELQNQNLVWKNIINSKILGNVSANLKYIDSLLQDEPELRSQINQNDVAISYHLVGKEKVAPLIALSLSPTLSEKTIRTLLEKHFKRASKTKKYDNIELNYFADSLSTSCYYFSNNCFVFSTSDLILERSARVISQQSGIADNRTFNALAQTKGNNATASLFINVNEFSLLLKQYSSSDFANALIALAGEDSWLGMDVSLQSNLVSLIGFYKGNSKGYFSTLVSQSPKKMETLDVLPVGAQQFFCINLSDIKTFRSKYEAYLNQQNNYQNYSLWNQKAENLFGLNLISTADNLFTGEFIKVNYGGTLNGSSVSYFMAKTKGKSIAENTIIDMLTRYCETSNVKLKKYTDQLKIDKDLKINVYKLPNPEMFEMLYGSVLNTKKLEYIGFFDNFLIAAENKEVLKNIIYSNILGKTLSRQSYFQDFYMNFTDAFNLLWYQDCRSIPETSKSAFSNELYDGLLGDANAFKNLNGVGFQLLGSKNMTYVNMAMDYSGEEKTEAETIWQSLLDTSISIKPALVENHYTKEKEIFVQDNSNTIYLISPSGRILWKKVINGKILSDIHQVDCYKNGKLQLLFNTSAKLYLIDRNGNHVDRFPVTLPSNASTGLGLIDYESSRDYRIFIPVTDKRILLYGIDGNTIKGWRFDRSDHIVTRPVQHFRISGKDYLVFSDKNRVYILDRQGHARIKLKEQFSKNPNTDFYLELSGPGGSPCIITGDTKGNIISILLSGNILKRQLPINSTDYSMSVANIDGLGSQEIIVVEGNTLRAFDQRGNTKFTSTFSTSISSVPYLYKFASRDIKIGVVCNEESKIYLVNNDGSITKEFPIFGTTAFTIGFLKADAGSFNLVVGGKDNFLYNYVIN